MLLGPLCGFRVSAVWISGGLPQRREERREENFVNRLRDAASINSANSNSRTGMAVE